MFRQAQKSIAVKVIHRFKNDPEILRKRVRFKEGNPLPGKFLPWLSINNGKRKEYGLVDLSSTDTHRHKCTYPQRYINESAMRDTKRKRAILDFLEVHSEWEYQTYGTPPYSATTIANVIGGSVQSVARTLRDMAATGVLVSVRDRQEVWNAIAKNHIGMTVTAYFSARTMQYDKAAARAYRNGAGERSARAFAKMFGSANETSNPANLLSSPTP